MRTALRVAALVLALGATPALGAGPNGGQTTVSDGHPVEFVATGSGVTFFLSDEAGKPVDTAGLAAKAFIQAGGRTETVTLRPAAPNRLVGDLKAPLAVGTKVVLSAKLHGHSLQARFEQR